MQMPAVLAPQSIGTSLPFITVYTNLFIIIAISSPGKLQAPPLNSAMRNALNAMRRNEGQAAAAAGIEGFTPLVTATLLPVMTESV